MRDADSGIVAKPSKFPEQPPIAVHPIRNACQSQGFPDHGLITHNDGFLAYVFNCFDHVQRTQRTATDKNRLGLRLIDAQGKLPYEVR